MYIKCGALSVDYIRYGTVTSSSFSSAFPASYSLKHEPWAQPSTPTKFSADKGYLDRLDLNLSTPTHCT